MTMAAVGVIGSGVMGRGVAQTLAQTNHRVVLVDVSEAQLASAEREIPRTVRLQTLLGQAKPGQSAKDCLRRITFTRDYKQLRTVDFVIENVTECWETKRRVYELIDEICPPEVPFGVNTSAISITRIGSVTRRGARVVGMHFMNPVPVMPVVELIRGFHTVPETIAAATALVGAMGKEAIVVEDSPGFVTNRVMMIAINEAAFLLQEQVSSVDDIDRLFKTCFGHKMGPFETADMIGVDTILRSLEVLYDSFADGKYRPCPLLKKMVHAGRNGRKSGEGFYRYNQA
jgi:3-hydroxybutyryl-CoA dehydrogenase